MKRRSIIVIAVGAVLIGSVPKRSNADDKTVGGGTSHQTSGTSSVGGCGGQTSQFSPADILRLTEESVQPQSKAVCYDKLFKAETSDNPACTQQAVPNPPGKGLCTLEGNPALRFRRGGPCALPNSLLFCDDESCVKNQVECCQQILKDTPTYFQPVNEGKVDNCERG